MIDSQRFSEWIQSVQGQYIDVDGGYGAQCWDLAAHWSAFLGLPVVNTGGNGRWPGWAGNMVDAYPQSDAVAAAYELVGPGDAAQAGDIAVWGDTFWYYPSTHVAVVVQDGAQLLTMSQNSTPSRADNPYPGSSTGPATIQHLPKGGLIGYLRPRVGLAAQGSVQTIQEDDMPITKEDAALIAGYVWNFDYEVDGRPAKPLWLLQSMDAIIRETIAKTAAATAQVILSTELPNVLTGGKTSLGLETSWDSYNVQALKDDQKPAGVSDAEFAAILREGIDKAVSGLSITLSAQKEN